MLIAGWWVSESYGREVEVEEYEEVGVRGMEREGKCVRACD